MRRWLRLRRLYFTFYENQVHCLAGNSDFLEKSIREYYGSMLDTGATTLYEQYDPKETGAQHYAMYGRPFEKSLCHAWSASPIYLFGRFRLGVVNTGVAYDTFEIRPQLGSLQKISGESACSGGYVYVKAEKDRVKCFLISREGRCTGKERRIRLKRREDYSSYLVNQVR